MPERRAIVSRTGGPRRLGLVPGRWLAVAPVFLLSGCALLTSVAPWEKEYLAQPEMVFDGARLEAEFDDHIYFSREGATGGWRMGGGGCGCN